MNKEILNQALSTTYETFKDRSNALNDRERSQYGKRQAETALAYYLMDNDVSFFTRTNLARKKVIENLKREEVAVYLAKYLTTKAKESAKEDNYIMSIIKSKFGTLSDYEIQMELAYCFLGAKERAFGEIDCSGITGYASELYVDDQIARSIAKTEELEKRVEETVDPKYGVKNVKLNPVAVNYCVQEILDGTQLSIQNEARNNPNSKYRPGRQYNLNDELFAVTDIGKRRENQEDSVLIMYHPSSPKYKMLVVADGVGGNADGEKASSEVVRNMIKWFNNLSPEDFAEGREQYLSQVWSGELRRLNESVMQKYPGAGSTFVGAIVGDKNTLVSSVGDSRAYVLGKDGELYQISDDDNLNYKDWKRTWEDEPRSRYEIKNGEEKELAKDLLRFRKDSNVITAGIGVSRFGITPHFKTIPNEKYTTLMLFSDGVTDCLSDKKIKAIASETKVEDLAQALVDAALDEISDLPISADGKANIYKQRIYGGKDNTTAAVYKNKEESER